jgi:serine phosphatase RsbU (regulator of sigma subunit)/putative methionine-R-sulfoxide reductase with GAF domain
MQYVPWLLLLIVVLAYGLMLLYLRYRRVRRSMSTRLVELETLSNAGRALVEAQLDINALAELIAAEASKVVDTGTLQIGLFEGDTYRILFWSKEGERQSPRVFDLSTNPGLIGWIRTSRQALTVGDYETEATQLPSRPRYLSDNPPRSGVFIPLLSGQNILGVVAAQSQQAHRFSVDDVRRLTILANQAAAAISNAYLYEKERARAAQLALVGKIAQRVNVMQDLDEIMQAVVHLTREQFGLHPVSILIMDHEAGVASLYASTFPNQIQQRIHIPPGYGLIGTALVQQTTVVSNETRRDPRFVDRLKDAPFDIPLSTRAELATPLIVDNQLLGVLDVQSETPGVFGAQEEMVFEALAAQVATAIYKNQQWSAQREQAWLTTARLQVAEAIGQSATLEEVLDAITRLVPLLIGAETCVILIWDGENEVYLGSWEYGLDDPAKEICLQCRLPIGAWSPLDAVHVGMENLETDKTPPWQESPVPTQRWGLFPLIAKGRIEGVIIISNVVDDQITGVALTALQTDLLKQITLQVGQAIAGERFQLAQQEEAWVNTALLQVAEAINSLIDLNEILDTIVRFVPMLVGIQRCAILIWDEESGKFHAGPTYGLSEMSLGLLHSFEIDAGEFPVLDGRVNERLPAATHFTVQLTPWWQSVLESDTALIFPLYARASLVGALVTSLLPTGHMISGRRLNILTGIGQQAAIAIVNHHLYQEAAERNRLEQELDVARTIQASFIPPGNPAIPGCSVASYWRAARQVGGDFYDFFQLPGGHWGILIADVADKGVPAALFMALSRTVLRTIAFNRDDPAEMLSRANQIICQDTTSDLFVTVFYAIWDPETGTLHYSNAGHNPPLLIRRSGKTRLLQGRGIALGVLEDIHVDREQARLRPGDVVLMYTDGVTEAINEDYDEFGLERLRLAATAAQTHDAQAIMTTVTAAVRDFACETSQFDDVTLVVMKRK